MMQDWVVGEIPIRLVITFWRINALVGTAQRGSDCFWKRLSEVLGVLKPAQRAAKIGVKVETPFSWVVDCVHTLIG